MERIKTKEEIEHDRLLQLYCVQQYGDHPEYLTPSVYHILCGRSTELLRQSLVNFEDPHINVEEFTGMRG